MKITFECHVVYDDPQKRPSIEKALKAIQENAVDIEIVPTWFDKPTIIVTKKLINSLTSKQEDKNK